MIEHATVFFAFFLNVHFSCNFVKVKRNDRSRPDNSHIQYQRIPSSNRLNHLCKVRNYLEIHINTTESQSTFFIYSIPFCVCVCAAAKFSKLLSFSGKKCFFAGSIVHFQDSFST